MIKTASQWRVSNSHAQRNINNSVPKMGTGGCMSKCNGLFQDKQEQTMKDRYFQYVEYAELQGETPMPIEDFAADLADELRERGKYE